MNNITLFLSNSDIRVVGELFYSVSLCLYCLSPAEERCYLSCLVLHVYHLAVWGT